MSGPNSDDFDARLQQMHWDQAEEKRLEKVRLTSERDEARAVARILAHSYVHDSRPPQHTVEAALAYPVIPSETK